MQYREYLESSLSSIVPEGTGLPQGYHLIGHVVLLTLKDESMPYAEQIGEATLQYDHRAKSVAVRVGQTKGITRKPQYKVVAGTHDTVTVHTENGVKFMLDPMTITFSGGNKRERVMLPSRVQEGEVVVDMFACVGQFALHIAKHTDAKVFALEINPEAFSFLQKNIETNGLQGQVTAVLGDCRKTRPSAIATRVVMGYLHDTTDYLPAALEALAPNGGIVHMHIACPEQGLDDIGNTVNTLASQGGFQSSYEVRKVKPYSPGVGHYIFDISVLRR
jgi:tRNA wybutosine-synthesizing protein 2